MPGSDGERDLSWLDYSSTAALSDDGQALLFTEAGGPVAQSSVYLRRLTDPAPVRLGDGTAQSLSPDGRWALALQGSPASLVLLPTKAGQPRTLPRGPIVDYHDAGWFPAGDRIAIRANEAGRPPRYFTQDMDGGPPVPLTPEEVSASDIVLSPDGRWLASFPPGARSRLIHLYPTQGGDPRPVPGLLTGDEPVCMSADGRALYVAKGGGPTELARVDLLSGRRTRLRMLMPADPAGLLRTGRVRLTPDGRWYVYNYFRQLATLYVVDGLR